MTAATDLAEAAAVVVDAYRDAMAVAAHNISVMEGVLPNVQQERVREQYNELIDRQLEALELMRSEFIEFAKDPDRGAQKALRLGALGMLLVMCHYEAKLLSPQLNLKPFKQLWTDAQVLAVVDDPRYPTRAEQAAKLGMLERHLYRRLKKLRPA
jgi:hypothetical protein